nr:hypothetical protein [Tanacetum cinerariifolium]
MAPLTFADTHNMITFLTKSAASEGFNQIVDFLTTHAIQYALMKVANLKQDKIAQALKITKLKLRVRKLEKKRRTKHSGLKKLRKVGIAHRVKSLNDTIMDDQEDASKLEGKIAELDVDEDVTIVDMDVEVEMDANVQGRMTESQAKAYNLDLQHSEKVLSIQDTDEAEPAEVEEVLEVVIAAKLMTEVVTTTAPITTVSQVLKTNAPRRRMGVVIQDPGETATTSVIMHTEDEAFVRQLEAELNLNINWNDVIDKARKNMMIYLKNMVGFKMDFFKEKEIEEKDNKRKGDSLDQDISNKQRIDEEAEELKTHLQIVANDDDDVYTEATPLALKVPVVDYQIHHASNKPYYKIIIADGTHKSFLSFITLLRNFDREDLKTLWMIVKERFKPTDPKNFLDDFLLNILKIMFEKPNVKANMFLLVEKKYPLVRFTLEQMLKNVRLEVEEESEMSLELLSFGVDAVQDFKKIC